LRKLEELGWSWNQQSGLQCLEYLSEEAEKEVMKKLSAYPDVIANAARSFEPHILANYLRELAGEFHSYYNAHKVLIEDENIRNARIALGMATKQVLANGLELLGVSQPEEM
jgi:arginyl-tRNA synthetase